jgi:hypothetical protein
VNPSALGTKSQKLRRKVLDVDADAVPIEGVRRVDHGDGQLELADDRQDGDGGRGVARPTGYALSTLAA